MYAKSIDATIYSDGFTTNPTNAWEIVSQYEKLHILPNGDSVNCLVSTADIILKTLEYRLNKLRLSLYPNNINQALQFENEKKDNFFFHIVSNRDYPKITPLKRAKFELAQYIKTPTYFLIKPEKSKVSMEFILQNNDKVVNDVFDTDGCLLFYNQHEHMRCLKDGDYLVYFDETGEATAKHISKIVKKKLKVIPFENFKK